MICFLDGYFIFACDPMPFPVQVLPSVHRNHDHAVAADRNERAGHEAVG